MKKLLLIPALMLSFDAPAAYDDTKYTTMANKDTIAGGPISPLGIGN